MGALGCCDRDSVHNDIDSPDKKVKKHGKNDIILSTPDEGGQSENANSRNREDIIEKSKNEQKEIHEKSKEVEEPGGLNPYKRNLINKKKEERKTLAEDENQYSSVKMKTIFNDDEIAAGERLSNKAIKTIQRDSYHSNRQTRESKFRDKLYQETKNNRSELIPLNIDGIGEKNSLITSDRSNKKNDESFNSTRVNKTNIIQAQEKVPIVSENDIYVITDTGKETDNEHIENLLINSKPQEEDVIINTVADNNTINAVETQPTTIEHLTSKPQLTVTKEELMRESNELSKGNIIIIQSLSDENSLSISKQLQNKTLSMSLGSEVNPNPLADSLKSNENSNHILYKTTTQNPTFSNRMQMFEKKQTEDKINGVINKSSTLTSKTNIFEKKLSIINEKDDNKDRKPAVSMDRTLQMTHNSTFKNNKSVDLNNNKIVGLSTTLQIPSYSNSPMKDRIKNLENNKHSKSLSRTITSNFVNIKTKNDIISEEEEAFLKKSLQSITIREEDNFDIECFEDKEEDKKKLKHKKSIRINKIAMELEKHLLSASGKVNPEVDNILKNDEYVHTINEKPVNKNKRKINRQEFF